MAESTPEGLSSARVGAVDPAPSTRSASSDSTVAVAPVHPQSVVIVRASGGQGESVPFGTSRRDGDVVVCGIRPGETMIVGRPDAVATHVSGTDILDRSGTVDIGHSRSVFEVSGLQATKALEKVCSLDWSDAMMPDGACGSASVAKIGCDVIRSDDDGRPRYLLLCDRSLGQYLYECLVDAAAEFVSRTTM
ncbi:MAG: hypothetical protein OER95_05395 [Acidimicrobiia bacterium]|nr:hypothetical protein [Acidimicrobiia bacterium]